MDYAIKTVGLTKIFSQNNLPKFLLGRSKGVEVNLAVNNINLQINRGQVFGLIGPNGAGKSTLMRMLCCLILPSKGSAQVAGYDILREERQIKSSIGLVGGEERSFYWRLTGRQNLDFFASLYNIPAQKAKLKIDSLLDLLEIENPDKKFQEYSTGTKQRLAISRSLLNDPKILFMDEPTKSLDVWCAQKLRSFIKDKLVKQQKVTVFLATHNLEEAEYLCDRTALMVNGEIRSCGLMEDIRKDILACSSPI
ncbi:MAG: ABC transporter ATP-binding protein [Candidatus Omnitrophota bacterium]